MLDSYHLEVLSLETPEDDPVWSRYLDVLCNAFLQPRPGDNEISEFRQNKQWDRSVLGMVTTTGPGLGAREPIAVLHWTDISLNSGLGPVPAMVINGLAVRASHRRRGLMRSLMSHHLGMARAAGKAHAVLTASEATIYRRFGFGVASRTCAWEIDLRKLAMLPEVPVADGSIEVVEPSVVAGSYAEIMADHQRRYRGAHSPLSYHLRQASGDWSFSARGPNPKLRYLTHFSPKGQLDGFLAFEHSGWEQHPPNPLRVISVCSPSPEIDRALWRGLASFDIVQTARYASAPYGDPLPLSLIDASAITVTRVDDAIWLRLLDLPQAVTERGFEAAGQVTIGVHDPLGFISGNWHITAEAGHGRATVAKTEPEVVMDAGTLSRMWLGDRSAQSLADAGVLRGSREAIRALGRLFATESGPVNLVDF